VEAEFEQSGSLAHQRLPATGAWRSLKTEPGLKTRAPQNRTKAEPGISKIGMESEPGMCRFPPHEVLSSGHGPPSECDAPVLHR
jgi:hypothetical protein